MNITIVCIGNLKESYLKGAVGEYAKRLSPFCQLKIMELDEYRLPKDPGNSMIEKGLRAEGDSIIVSFPKNAKKIALCIEGKALSSPAFAGMIQDWSLAGFSHLVFVIGGSHGLSDEVKAACDYRLSLSGMTFPHQLTRVLLLEQLYRAFSILQGGKYHK